MVAIGMLMNKLPCTCLLKSLRSSFVCFNLRHSKKLLNGQRFTSLVSGAVPGQTLPMKKVPFYFTLLSAIFRQLSHNSAHISVLQHRFVLRKLESTVKTIQDRPRNMLRAQ
jgi:hypothetical protein